MLVRETLQWVVHQEEIGKWSKKGQDASEKKEKRNGKARGKLVKGGCDELFEESVGQYQEKMLIYM